MNDDLMRMVQQIETESGFKWCVCFIELEQFAALVAAAEREACAKLLDENAKQCSKDSMARMILFSNATAIRARGNDA